MKLKYILFAFASAAIVAGCSKSRTEVSAPEVEPGENDPVPVTFSSSSLGYETKAMVTGEVMANLEIGIYGISSEISNPEDFQTPDDRDKLKYKVNWNPAVPDTYIAGLVNKSVTTDGEGNIVFNPKIYYPLNSDKTFSFFGYHPYSADVNNAQGQCTVTYDLTDQPDILWAEDHARPLRIGSDYDYTYGFNARYVRKVDETPAAQGDDKFHADLKFSHKLTALDFVVKTEDSEAGKMKVTGLELADVATNVTLYIMSIDETRHGTVVGNTNGDLQLSLIDGEGAPATDGVIVPNTDEGVSVGTIMLLPGTSYKANLTLALTDGNGGWTEQSPMSVDITTTVTGGEFVAGNKYTLTLNILRPVEVDIETSLDDWDDVDGGEITIG